MPTEYVSEDVVTNAVTGMLAEMSYTEFTPIRNNDVTIEVCVCHRTNKDGEDMPPKHDPISVKKVSAADRLYIEADYILIVDNSAWNTANSSVQQTAMIHRGLMKINIEEGKKGEKCKFGTRKPTIMEFPETLYRFGAYNQDLLDVRESIQITGGKVARELQLKN